ncbi:MAG: site-specific integrase [Clostridium sp.]|nr:site-specific integrase [Clostridium sp.]
MDLRQFSECLKSHDISDITMDFIETFIAFLHQTYKPKTVRRKIASVKAFFHYLEYKDLIIIKEPAFIALSFLIDFKL